MANSYGKKKNQPGWLIAAIVILILLGIKNRNDRTPADNVVEGNVSSTAAVQNGSANKTILSAVPEELRDNFFLKQKENGCCKTLSGDVAIAVIMVDDSVSKWNNEAKAELQTELQTNSKAVIEDASAYEIDLSITFHYYTACVTEDVGSNDEKQWQEEALESAGLPAMSQVHDYLIKQYSAKEAPVMFVLNKTGRATASYAKSESMTMYHKSGYDGFEHELLHIFGAQDYYYPEEVDAWAGKRFSDSIMNSGEEVDALTAYLIGWTDTLSDNAIGFLEDSISITTSYMLEQNEKELFTGYGTKEYDDGVYTGDLVRGFRHGTGTMQYNNGGWYTGQWDNGKKAGAGTGKIIYENGSVYEGEFMDGKCHGTGKVIYESGSVYEGEFQNGKLQGQGTYTNVNGSVYTGYWNDGERTGKGTGKEIYDNGYYEGEFYNGQRHGQGTYVWTSGSQYTGQWVEGSRTGYGTYTWPDGKTKSGNWNNGEFVE